LKEGGEHEVGKERMHEEGKEAEEKRECFCEVGRNREGEIEGRRILEKA